MAPKNENPVEPARQENRKSLVAFLRSIRFLRRSKKRQEPIECESHFASLQATVEPSSNDDVHAVRSAN